MHGTMEHDLSSGFVGFKEFEVMTNRNKRGYSYPDARGEILRQPNAKSFAKNSSIIQELKSEARRRFDTFVGLTINDSRQRSSCVRASDPFHQGFRMSLR
ncbi:hypothetical protein TNCT_123081 [Trichonephila clavata]|uniref:Uncharacterized protein n=1 Tax=Trichonephila clavata TaxID=2740835 RepID=A0A8X6J1P3_TRICU|nr:hypothetical protein TNCT_123081 [Trichonephila clavata]